MADLFRPSNAIQGDAFSADWCEQCVHIVSPCPIRLRTMALAISDPDYPREWTFDAEGEPICTAFLDRSAA